MQKVILLLTAVIFQSASFCQQTNRIHLWLGPKALYVSHNGLDNFNNVIAANGKEQISTATITGGALLYTHIGRWEFGLDASAVSLHNKMKPPQTQIIFSYISGDFNAGFNLLGANPKTRLSPFAGIGLQFTQVYFISHDSTITLNETIQGAQNMNYQRPALGVTAHGGLRFCQFAGEAEKFGFFTEFIYTARLNRYNWKIPDMPIDPISATSFSAGVIFRITD